MGSLIDELQRREAAARAEAEQLRGQIAQLAARLAGVEEQLSRLVIAREVVDEVLDGATTAAVSPVAVAPGQPEVTASPGSGRSPVIGVLAVPPWRSGLGFPCCRRTTGICWRWPRMPGGRCGRRRSPRRPCYHELRIRRRPAPLTATAPAGLASEPADGPYERGATGPALACGVARGAHPSGAPILKSCNFAVRPVGDRRPPANGEGAPHICTRRA